jgi:hypothetical protein
VVRPRLARLLVLLVTVLVLASCGAAPSPSDATFIGDSITDRARSGLHERFGVDDSRVVAVGGATIQDMGASAQAAAAGDPPIVVVNLGTNDVLLLDPPEEIAGRLDAMVEELEGARCVYVVTINERMVSPQGGDPKAIAAALNTTIRGWDGSDNRHVVDWAKVVNDYDAAGAPDGPVTTDTVHPTEVGQAMLLDEIGRELETC